MRAPCKITLSSLKATICGEHISHTVCSLPSLTGRGHCRAERVALTHVRPSPVVLFSLLFSCGWTAYTYIYAQKVRLRTARRGVYTQPSPQHGLSSATKTWRRALLMPQVNPGSLYRCCAPPFFLVALGRAELPSQGFLEPPLLLICYKQSSRFVDYAAF